LDGTSSRNIQSGRRVHRNAIHSKKAVKLLQRRLRVATGSPWLKMAANHARIGRSAGTRRSKQGLTQMQADARKTRKWDTGCRTGAALQGVMLRPLP
jgi:hypothetical protein